MFDLELSGLGSFRQRLFLFLVLDGSRKLPVEASHNDFELNESVVKLVHLVLILKQEVFVGIALLELVVLGAHGEGGIPVVEGLLTLF